MKKLKEKPLLISHKSNLQFEDIRSTFGLNTNQKIIIAGPCAIYNHNSFVETVAFLKTHNIKLIRAATFKPRTSPYSFQGLGHTANKIIKETKRKYKVFCVSEIMDPRELKNMLGYADVLQIGARNMQNFSLLKEIGGCNKPILLKRGLAATLEEFMLAAEYLAVSGSRSIILCERGLRTPQTHVRNLLDIAAIPVLKKETKLPVIVDLSHSLGRTDVICEIARGVIAAGADGIMVEVFKEPHKALSDATQQITFNEFTNLMNSIGNSR
ncbi:MAG: bifunctional 3-deoxy-7-phosphoheptulonate synthase/chorismate mutase [Oscillospiraceae bacterium]|nr:bifunctional 3-deoxy-7-phosphoheptulonate synthase/chorismate mutase [Oscillospiraceae bacterium]